jgi:DNA-binding transcriptional LysR family regulator
MLENFRLRVFRAVAQHLNFSRAAEELLLTQPAVTQQIKALEEELGVALFDRGGGHIALTPGGCALLPFAESMRSLADEAVAAVAGAYGEQGGELAVGASQTIAQYLLPRWIAEFAQANLRVRVTARTGNTDEILQALVKGEIDLALIEGPEQRKDLRIEPFMEDRMILVVPAGHEWAGETIGIEALAGEPMLMREFGSGSRRVVEQALAAAGVRIRALHICMEFDSTEGLLSGVEAGLGVTFVSRWAVRNQLALGTLKTVRVRGLKLERSFSLAFAAGPEPGGAAGAFRSLLLTRKVLVMGRGGGVGVDKLHADDEQPDPESKAQRTAGNPAGRKGPEGDPHQAADDEMSQQH